MDKEALLKLNRVPDGKPPWLDYKAFRRLQQLFERLTSPAEMGGLGSEDYYRMHDFLIDVAGIAIPEMQEAVHLNAFILIRRGYRVEEITEAEHERLLQLLEGTEIAALDDVELYDFGNHRSLYTYLSEGLGIYVEPGRGPVWHRAQQLVDHYRHTQDSDPVLENPRSS